MASSSSHRYVRCPSSGIYLWLEQFVGDFTNHGLSDHFLRLWVLRPVRHVTFLQLDIWILHGLALRQIAVLQLCIYVM